MITISLSMDVSTFRYSTFKIAIDNLLNHLNDWLNISKQVWELGV